MAPPVPFKKMFLVPPEFLDRLRQPNKTDEQTDEWDSKIKNILKSKKKRHPYDTLADLRRYQDPYLKRLHEKRQPIQIPYVEESLPSTGAAVKKKRKIGKLPKHQIKRKQKVKKRKLVSFVDDGEVFESPATDVTPRNVTRAEEEDDDNDDDDDEDEESELAEIIEFTNRKFGHIAGKYLSPYVKKQHDVDPIFGIRRENEGFKIGQSDVSVSDNKLFVDGVPYEGTEGLWELVTKKDVDESKVTKHDLETYKKILIQSKVHLDKTGRPRSSRGKKYKQIISKLFPVTRQRWTSVN